MVSVRKFRVSRDGSVNLISSSGNTTSRPHLKSIDDFKPFIEAQTARLTARTNLGRSGAFTLRNSKFELPKNPLLTDRVS